MLAFDRPMDDLRQELAAMAWDSDPVAVLTRRHVSAIIDRFLNGELSADTVEAWANLVEGRDDIAFEPDHDKAVAEAVHDLANPELSGRLDAIVTDVRARLLASEPS